MRQRWNLDGEQGVLIEIKLFALQLQRQNSKVRVAATTLSRCGVCSTTGLQAPRAGAFGAHLQGVDDLILDPQLAVIGRHLRHTQR